MSRQAGFSIVEVILATAVFSLLAGALAGIVIYGQAATANAGDRLRANQLAEEGLEAVRSIRDAGYANLSDGTFGIAQTGNVWTLAGSQDVKGIYTRQITITNGGANRKDVLATVTWPAANGTVNSATATSRLTNWLAAVAAPKAWTGTTVSGSYDVSGSQDGFKVVTAGNLAYVIRNVTANPNFLIIDISNPAIPTLTGSLNLTGNPTNIFVSGNYAYISNSADAAELQIINVATPASPSLVATYNAPGTGNGQAVFVSGANVFLARAADTNGNELIILNASNPAAPTVTGGYNNNSVSMTDVLVSGDYIFIGTNSSSAEILQLNALSLVLPILAASTDLTTSGAVTDMKISGNTLLVAQGSSLSILNISNPTAITRSGTVTATGSATINDITIDSTAAYAFLATANTAAELQIVSIAVPASASVVGTVDVSGTASTLNGIAYNSTLDVLVGTGANDTQEVITFIKN